MSLKTLFKLVTCWCAPNTVRQVVPRGRACDGERTLAELQTGYYYCPAMWNIILSHLSPASYIVFHCIDNVLFHGGIQA